MPQANSVARFSLRFSAVFLGIALLSFLVLRAGPQAIWSQIHKVGLGLAVIIVLGGMGYLIRTWAWRCTFACDISALHWTRSFGACLVSEALGQLGAGGKVLGEGMRVSLLKPAVPLANAIPSVAIDSVLHVSSSAIVSVLGIVATLLLAPLPQRWRTLALVFAAALVTALMLGAVAIGKGWALMGHAARAIGHVPRFQKWISREQPLIDSSESNLLNFFHQAPAAFCSALLLNFLWQALAILEVYLILRFIGIRLAIPGAFVLEGLTKIINLVGVLNPGNVGTFEGGNMLITNLFGVPGPVGLTLALCRRARALFWAMIGAVCLMLMSKPAQRRNDGVNPDSTPAVQL